MATAKQRSDAVRARQAGKIKAILQTKRNPLDIESVSNCNACINLSADHVPSEGDPQARIMLVGQSPGATERDRGRPFVGASGELVDQMLFETGIRREDVYITNALKCKPPGNRKGHPTELNLCRKIWLSHELKSVNPEILILVGKDAHQSIVGDKFPFKHCRSVKGASGRTYLSIYHPAYYIRRGVIVDFVMSVSEKLKELLGE